MCKTILVNNAVCRQVVIHERIESGWVNYDTSLAAIILATSSSSFGSSS